MAGQIFPIFSIYGIESTEEILLREGQDLLTNQDCNQSIFQEERTI